MAKYFYVGSAEGRFESNKTGNMIGFSNMYVISPVSDYQSNDYASRGYKAEKFKCVSNAVYQDLDIGDEIEAYFDSQQRIALVKRTGETLFTS